MCVMWPACKTSYQHVQYKANLSSKILTYQLTKNTYKVKSMFINILRSSLQRYYQINLILCIAS